MNSRNITSCNLFSDIDSDSSERIVDTLFRSKFPIVLNISSLGGDVYYGLAIIDAISYISVPVYTVAWGHVASMGVHIYLAGKKRYLTPNCSFMIHNTSLYFEKEHHIENLEDWIAFQKQHDERLNQQIIKKTQITRAYLDDWYSKKKDIYFTANEAIEWGIGDSIIKNSKTLEKEIEDSLPKKNKNII